MSKSYDHVEWSFQERILHQLGLCYDFVQLISKCIRTASYKFKVNGSYTDSVIPGRGLHKGDPISPYPFLLCAEGFSALLHQAEQVGNLKGIRVASSAPTVSHLLFVDDSLLFFEATEDGGAAISQIIAVYEAGSGQMINRDKSGHHVQQECKGMD